VGGQQQQVYCGHWLHPLHEDEHSLQPVQESRFASAAAGSLSLAVWTELSWMMVDDAVTLGRAQVSDHSGTLNAASMAGEAIAAPVKTEPKTNALALRKKFVIGPLR
jgi:hypothetical protein